MASYFDLPPQKVAAPACIEQIPQEQRNQLGRTSSLMSPAVAQILEGLGDDHSSSSDEDSDLSDDQEKEHPQSQSKKDISAQKIQQKKQKFNSAQAPRPSSLSPNRSRSRSRSATRKVSNMPSSAEWSNHGPRIDILAPGLDITSTLPNGVVDSFSGTSMAAPHVVGLAAYLLGLGSPSKDLCGTIAALAIKNAIDQDTLPKGTPNLLAFNGADASQKRMKHL